MSRWSRRRAAYFPLDPIVGVVTASRTAPGHDHRPATRARVGAGQQTGTDAVGRGRAYSSFAAFALTSAYLMVGSVFMSAARLANSLVLAASPLP